jgi:uncharacterized membrane protein YjgN (DUF898 family)
MEGAQAAATLRRAQFSFTGSGSEYFRIWIVNVLLSIITLGIYSAWAKVRRERYFAGNTLLDGHRFEYLADPVGILKGRLVAVAVLAAYLFVGYVYPTAGFYATTALLVAIPAILVMATGFRLRNTAYRNIRFAFRGRVIDAYRRLLTPLLTVLVLWAVGYAFWAASDLAVALESVEDAEFQRADMMLSILLLALVPVMPYLECLRARFTAEHATYGSQTMQFNGKAGAFYNIYAASSALWLALVAVVMVVVMLSPAVFAASAGDPDAENTGAVAGIVAGLSIYSALVFVAGYLASRKTNLIYNNLSFGETSVHSRLRARDVSWIYLSNTLAIVASLGLLIPWAKVRMARYAASRTEMEMADLDEVTASRQADRSALGEELGEAFGFDFSV